MQRSCSVLWGAVLTFAMALPTQLSGQTIDSPVPNYGVLDPTYNDEAGNAPEGMPAYDPQIVALLERLRQSEERIQQLEQQRQLSPDTTHFASSSYNADGEEAFASRLAKIEDNLAKQKEDADKARADAAKKPSLKWSGRIHADYWSFADTSPAANFWENGNANQVVEDRILFRRVRFGVAGDMLETMNYKIEMEFAQPDVMAFKDVYVGWKELPYLQTVLLGNQKRPYGLDHLNSSRYNIFMERPFIVEAITPDSRRFGVCSYGVTENEAWNWRYGAFLPQDMQRNGIYRTAQDGLAHDYQAEVSGRLANTLWYDESSDGRGYAHWAVSGAYVHPDFGAGGANVARFATRPEARTDGRWLDTGSLDASRYTMLGLESLVNLGAFSVCGEYMVADVDRVNASNVTFPGYYVYAAYWLTGEHTPWERESGVLGRTKPFENFFLVPHCDGGCDYGLGAWQVSARYSHADFNDADVLGGIGDAVTFAVNWWWTPYSRMQFNYINGQIDDRNPQNYNAAGIPAGALGPTSGSYNTLALRWMVDF
ncbi:MAG: OprO/OprP family phosphate-selective porin [Pirellulaceae bacterium]